MLKNNRWLVLLSITLLLYIGIKACSPVPIPLERYCREVKGLVSAIHLDGTGDIFFTIDNTNKRFYINHGLSKGLEIDTLKAMLIGNEVVIKYPRYWTPLDPLNRVRHISKLEFQDSTIFSELLDPKLMASPTR